MGKCAKIKENGVFSGIIVTLSSSRRYVKVQIGIKLVFLDSTGIIPYNKPDQTFTSELIFFRKKWAVLGPYRTYSFSRQFMWRAKG